VNRSYIDTVPTSEPCARVSSLVEAAMLLGLDRADVTAYRDWCERASGVEAPVLQRRAS
jgi:hypothetical protein